jgi:hypothetical protein
MVMSTVGTVEEYIASLPEGRRGDIAAVRRVLSANLPPGFEEGMLYGMIGYYVPFSRLADTYNKQPLCLAGLASQKGHMSLYLMCVYGSAKQRKWFEQEYRRAGKKLDMGKSCLRFKSVDDLPLELVGKAIASVGIDDYIASYHASRARTKRAKSKAAGKRAPVAKRAAAKRPPAKSAARKSAARKSAARKSGAARASRARARTRN